MISFGKSQISATWPKIIFLRGGVIVISLPLLVIKVCKKEREVPSCWKQPCGFAFLFCFFESQCGLLATRTNSRQELLRSTVSCLKEGMLNLERVLSEMCQNVRVCVSLCYYPIASSTVELLLFYIGMTMVIIWFHTCNTTFNLSVQLCHRFIVVVENTELLRNRVLVFQLLQPGSLMSPRY